MTDHRAQIAQLLKRAEGMGRGPAQVALTEQAVHIADAHGDVEEAYKAREALIRAAIFSGQADVALVAFSWNLSQYDARPDLFDAEELLWRYKWIADELSDFPQISREQIEATLGDMERRFRAAGSTLHAVHQIRRDLATSMGDRDAAERAHQLLLQAPRDSLSNCTACVADNTVDYFALRGEDEAALEAAEFVFRRRLTCEHVPQRTHARMLLPLFRLNRVAEAMAHHRKGYPLIATNAVFVAHWATHVLLLALTDNLVKALRIVESGFGAALATVNLTRQFEFFRAARFVLSRLRERGEATLTLRLPAEFPRHRADGRYDVAELFSWLDGRLNELASRFDARNGNDHFRRRVANLDQPWRG